MQRPVAHFDPTLRQDRRGVCPQPLLKILLNASPNRFSSALPNSFPNPFHNPRRGWKGIREGIGFPTLPQPLPLMPSPTACECPTKGHHQCLLKCLRQCLPQPLSQCIPQCLLQPLPNAGVTLGLRCLLPTDTEGSAKRIKLQMKL